MIDSTLQLDRGLKAIMYALEGIKAYWIVNIKEAQVECYSEPGSSGYRLMQDYRSDAVVPFVFDGRELGTISVRELLP